MHGGPSSPVRRNLGTKSERVNTVRYCAFYPISHTLPVTQTLRAVVLDVDGTLVDSERDGHRVAFNLAFEELDLPYRWSPELYGELLLVTGGKRRIAGYLEREGVGEPERDDLAARLHRRKTELFQGLIEDGRVQPRPGVPELLDELATEGVRVSVATTGSRQWVAPLLDQLFGLDRFEVVITCEEAPDLKPDPSAYLLALEQLKLEPGGEVVALEDSHNGLVAAKAACLSCVVVVNDYTREQDFADSELVLDGFGADGPVGVLHDPYQLAPGPRLDVATLRRVAKSSRGQG